MIGEPLCDVGNPSFLKIKWSFADVTAFGSRERGERDIVGMIPSVFGPIQTAFAVREPLFDVGISS